MRILYFSDRWGYNIMSVKRALLEELKVRGIDVVYQNRGHITNILKHVKTLKFDQIWLAHSGLMLPCDKSLIKPPVIGFGFSDPHYFSDIRLKSYDIYVTAYYGTYLKYKGSMPVHYCPGVANLRHYINLKLKRDIDISHVGTAIQYTAFTNKKKRIEFINQLRKDTDLDIHVYGGGWPQHVKNSGRVEGNDYLNIINRSKIGLDIQDDLYAPTQRLYDYAACGTPMITRGGDDVYTLFEKDKEILTYNSYDELKEKLIYYTEKPQKLRDIGMAAMKRCIKDHNYKCRVDYILDFIEKEKK